MNLIMDVKKELQMAFGRLTMKELVVT